MLFDDYFLSVNIYTVGDLQGVDAVSKLLVKFGGKAGVALKKFGAEAGKASVKYGGQLGVLLVKLGKVLLVLLKRLLQEIVRATPYVVGFFQQLFRLIADGIKKLINLIMSKM